MLAQIQQPAPDLRNSQANILENISDTILKILEKEPGERFSSAEEFATAVQSSK